MEQKKFNGLLEKIKEVAADKRIVNKWPNMYVFHSIDKEKAECLSFNFCGLNVDISLMQMFDYVEDKYGGRWLKSTTIGQTYYILTPLQNKKMHILINSLID